MLLQQRISMLARNVDTEIEVTTPETVIKVFRNVALVQLRMIGREKRINIELRLDFLNISNPCVDPIGMRC